MADDGVAVRIPFPIPPHRLDPDALGVVLQLLQAGFETYLVGGCIRDVYLRLPPKDFDIATAARPNQVKRVFRNCRIIGRRFRLAHVYAGSKILEVATFRAMSQDEPTLSHTGRRLVQEENVFGTPAEDAMRRDFTINGLFYDVQRQEIVDYVGGATDLRRGLVRCIGDPEIRLIEDPVRMIRALKLAGRMEFRLDPPLADGIRRWADRLSDSSPARIMEELFKILASGAARHTVELMAQYGLIEGILPRMGRYVPGAASASTPAQQRPALYKFLDALDIADQGLRTHSNAVLLASLFLPMMDPDGRFYAVRPAEAPPSDQGSARGGSDDLEAEELGIEDDGPGPVAPPPAFTGGNPAVWVAAMVRSSSVLRNLSRRDLFRLGQILMAQRKMASASPESSRSLVSRPFFPEALALFKIASRALDLPESRVQAWEAMGHKHQGSHGASLDEEFEFDEGDFAHRPRRRRRNRF